MLVCPVMEDDQIRSYRDLEAWQMAMDLVDHVRTNVNELPREEWDLRRQMWRACVSIPANVAEGWRRKKRRGAYQNHVSIAMGSQGELETELEVCFRNKLLDRKKCEMTSGLCTRAGQLLDRLHDSLY